MRPFRIVPLPDADPRPVDDGPVSLLRAIGVTALRHRLKLAAWVAICLVAAFLYARATPLTYTAATTLLLEPRRQVLTNARETVAPQTLDLSRADSELQVIRSERLLSTVFAALKLADHPELRSPSPSVTQELAQSVLALPQGLWQAVTGFGTRSRALAATPEPESARSPGETERELASTRVAFENFVRRFSGRRVGQSYVLEIAYESSDPGLPARVANAAASAYLLQSVAFKADAARSGGEYLQGRLDALSAQVDAARLAVSAGELPAVPTPDADAKIIGAAQVPLGPSAPRRGLILGFGGVFGLLSGLFIGAIGSVLDRKARRPEDITRETGLPCLATVPKISTWKELKAIPAPEMASLVTGIGPQDFVDAIRDLRTAIEITRSDGNLVIAVGSWKAGDGAGMLTVNLGQLMRLGGRRISILGAKLDPILETMPDFEGYPTMVDAIAKNLSPDQITFLQFHGMRLLPIPSDVPELNWFVDLREPRVARIIAHAKLLGDVLIDLPPLDEAADALALATHADCVILVAEDGSTTFDALNDAAGKLRRAGTNVLGVVLNRSQL